MKFCGQNKDFSRNASVPFWQRAPRAGQNIAHDLGAICFPNARSLSCPLAWAMALKVLPWKRFQWIHFKFSKGWWFRWMNHTSYWFVTQWFNFKQLTDVALLVITPLGQLGPFPHTFMEIIPSYCPRRSHFDSYALDEFLLHLHSYFPKGM